MLLFSNAFILCFIHPTLPNTLYISFSSPCVTLPFPVVNLKSSKCQLFRGNIKTLSVHFEIFKTCTLFNLFQACSPRHHRYRPSLDGGIVFWPAICICLTGDSKPARLYGVVENWRLQVLFTHFQTV